MLYKAFYVRQKQREQIQVNRDRSSLDVFGIYFHH